MKPSGVLLYIVAVFLLLLAVSLYVPEEGITIAKGLRIRFFAVKDILQGDRESYADIGEILRMQEMLNDTIIEEYAGNTPASDTARADRAKLIAAITRIEYPGGDSTLLHPFFSRLRRAGSSAEMLRILHYGDSQIEDDRITSYLRYRLQAHFGGTGVGLVPVAQLFPYSSSLMQTNSDNWYRFVVCGRTDSTLSHDRYGVLGSFGMFTPPVTSSGSDATAGISTGMALGNGAGTSAETSAGAAATPIAVMNAGSDEAVEAWVTFGPSRYAYENTKSFNHCRVFYGYNESPFMVELFLGDSLYDADMKPASHALNTMEWDFGTAREDLTLRFTGENSPQIYGIALDGHPGVAVDNIALRGCSGPFLTRMDAELLGDMYGELNVGLVILQFGGNMVPAEISSFSGYENWFVSQIALIRELCPASAVLIISVADMSVKENDRFITDPNVEKVRNALKNAARRSDAAFWDMYRAMGGKNSMPSWVNASPSLAAGDYVHFNPLGAKTIAQMFYNAFLLEYQQFEKDAQR